MQCGGIATDSMVTKFQ